MTQTYRSLKKVQEYEKSLRCIHYEVGKLYKVIPTYKNIGATIFHVAQPQELSHNRDYPLFVNSLILCVERGYLVEKPQYPSGGNWPIINFNGLTQGNLFLYDNVIFFISIANTYYDQHIILKEVDLNDPY